MMKLIIIIAATLILTACASGEQYEGLLGTWRWQADGAYIYTFNYDGTGERGFYETLHTFTWGVHDETLRIDHGRLARGLIRNERWAFTIEDNALTIVSEQAEYTTYSYLRAADGRDEALSGVWRGNAPDHSFIYDDGEGHRGDERFYWATRDNILEIHRESPPHNEIRIELWQYEIDGDTLTLTSLQDEDAEQLILTNAG